MLICSLIVLVVVDYQLMIAIVAAMTQYPSPTPLQQRGPMKDDSCKFNLRVESIGLLYNI